MKTILCLVNSHTYIIVACGNASCRQSPHKCCTVCSVEQVYGPVNRRVKFGGVVTKFWYQTVWHSATLTFCCTLPSSDYKTHFHRADYHSGKVSDVFTCGIRHPACTKLNITLLTLSFSLLLKQISRSILFKMASFHIRHDSLFSLQSGSLKQLLQYHRSLRHKQY